VFVVSVQPLSGGSGLLSVRFFRNSGSQLLLRA